MAAGSVSALESILEADPRRRRFLGFVAWGGLSTVVIAWSGWQIGMNPRRLVAGTEFMLDFLARTLPPDLSYVPQLWQATGETILIAVWGTLLAVILAVPASLLAARNITWNTGSFLAARLGLNGLRAINELIFALLFVSAVGLGAFAGVLAIALHAAGMLGKFCAEEIEGVDRGPVEALQATGARRLQVIVYAIVPQVLPAFVAYTIYRLDVAVRTATILGLVGAGGLGFQLITTMKLFQYRRMASCIAVIFALVWLSDLLSSRLRARII